MTSIRTGLSAILLGALMVVLATGTAAQRAGTSVGEKQLERARQKEVIEGDVAGAIKDYQAIADTFKTSQRPVAAQALLAMAGAFEKMGDARLRNIYARLGGEYGDLPEGALARARQAAAATSSSAGPTIASVMQGDITGAVSANGRVLTFIGDGGNLVARDLQTGLDRTLTSRGEYVGQSVPSRDGRVVAYQVYAGGCESSVSSAAALCLVSTEGTGVPVSRTLVQSPEMSIAPMDWSPDGRTLAVSIGRPGAVTQIGLVSVADGAVTVIESVDWRGPTRVFFSPDGRDLAYDVPVGDNGEHRDIVVRAVNGTGGAAVVSHAAQDVVIGWTPGGTLLFASDRAGSFGLWEQSFSNRRPQGDPRLVRAAIGSAWSLGITTAGAVYLGVTHSERDVVVATVDLASGRETAPRTRPIQRYVGTNLMPVWSADGKFLAYVSGRGFNPTNNTGRMIGIQTVETGEAREVHAKLLYFNQIAWSPDGRAFVTAGTDLKNRDGVFRVDARTGDVELIVTAQVVAYPKWSTDGTRIYYRRRNDNVGREWTLTERVLTSGAERSLSVGEIVNFAVSPDGEWLAMVTGGALTGRSDAVRLLRVATGETREIWKSSPAEFASHPGVMWTPDGRALIVRKSPSQEFWIVPTTGAAPRKLDVDPRGIGNGSANSASLHSDGRRLALTAGGIRSEIIVLGTSGPAPVTPKPVAAAARAVSSGATGVSSADLDDFVGTYTFPTGPVAVTRDGNTLFGEAQGGPKSEVTMTSGDEFFVPSLGAPGRFVRDASNKVTSMVVGQGPQAATGVRQR